MKEYRWNSKYDYLDATRRLAGIQDKYWFEVAHDYYDNDVFGIVGNNKVYIFDDVTHCITVCYNFDDIVNRINEMLKQDYTVSPVEFNEFINNTAKMWNFYGWRELP